MNANTGGHTAVWMRPPVTAREGRPTRGIPIPARSAFFSRIQALINRWLHYPEYQHDLNAMGRGQDAETIKRETHELIGQSIKLSYEMFGQFLRPLGQPNLRHVLPSR